MKNLDQFPENPSPRPTDASNPRTPRRRRRLNLAKALGGLAGIVLLTLGGFALNTYQAWRQPMPLAHKIVTTTTALPALASVPATVTDSQGQVALSVTTVYVGQPIVLSFGSSVPTRVVLPASATVTPAGLTVETGPISDGLGWRSSPGTDSPILTPATNWGGYASWFVRFDAPRTYSIPVTLGTSTRDVTIRVLPLPAGAHLSVKTSPADHPSLVVSNPGNAPIHVSGAGLPSTLTPGQSVTVTPGATYDVVLPQSAQTTSLGFGITQTTGTVHFAGTITTHHRVSFRPAHPPFRLPLWFLLALVLALLLLVASTVASLTGGHRGKGPGTAGPKGTGANAS